jgi:hypothetical protein
MIIKKVNSNNNVMLVNEMNVTFKTLHYMIMAVVLKQSMQAINSLDHADGYTAPLSGHILLQPSMQA